jgi:hypothetical protein
MTFSRSRLKFSAELFPREMVDEHSPDFRHCRVQKLEGEAVVLTFLGKLTRSQAVRNGAERDIERWCELNPDKLPSEGGTVLINLDEIQK